MDSDDAGGNETNETIVRFKNCQQKRMEAAELAKAAGKSDEQAAIDGQDAAAKAWNDWAWDLITKLELFKEKKAKELQPREPGESWESWRSRHQDVDLRNWIGDARVDFRLYPFSEANFTQFIFPCEAIFANAVFDGRTCFDGAKFHGEACFANTKLKGEVTFDKVYFKRGVTFADAEFSDLASFELTKFLESAVFNGAKFKKDVLFSKAKFSEVTSFDETKFRHDASFTDAHFYSDATFEDARFHESAQFARVHFCAKAFFLQASFLGFASFRQATFEGETNFGAIQGDRGFDLTSAKFHKLPDFTQAHFVEGPRLDDVQILWKMGLPFFTRHEVRHAVTAKYRALKRLAAQNQDHDCERFYFRGELRTMRGDYWFWNWRKWMSVLYQLFGNFGSSVVRPVVWWAVIWFVSMAHYLERHIEYCTSHQAHCSESKNISDCFAIRIFRVSEYYIGSGLQAFSYTLKTSATHWSAPNEHINDAVKYIFDTGSSLQKATGLRATTLNCVAGKGSALHAAAGLAFANGTGGFLGAAREDKIKQTFACLYGINTSFKGLSEQELIPMMPDDVVVWGALQALLSLALLFLLLLALRNHFRISA